MNIEEFIADKQAKMERVAKLQEQITTDKEKLKEVEQAYNTALVEGNDNKTDKLFTELTTLKKQNESNSFKADKLSELNDELIHKNAEKAFLHLKSIQAEYEKKAKALDDEMKPIQKQALKLLHKSDDLANEYRDVTQEYFRLAEDYKVNTRNKGLSRYSTLEVFKETGVRVNGYGVVAEPIGSKQAKNDRLNVLPENATITDFAKANRLIGGE